MEDISQTVLHLSKHMIDTLSNSFRADGTNWSVSSVDAGIVDGVHNPSIFFQNLFSRQTSRESDQQLHPRLLARIRIPFAGLNVSRHERMTVKSRRVVDVDDLDETSVQGTDPSFRAPVETNLESSLLERSSFKHRALEEARGDTSEKSEVTSAVSKEDLGRATWTFLHTLAAQFPDQPTKQQRRDVKDLMALLSRIYPCKDCADHFKDVLKAHPVEANSGEALAQWMCRVHNVVNRSLGKPQFPCNRVDLRWGALNCSEGACDLHGRLYK